MERAATFKSPRLVTRARTYVHNHTFHLVNKLVAANKNHSRAVSVRCYGEKTAMRLAYDTTQPCVSDGAWHTEDDTIFPFAVDAGTS